MRFASAAIALGFLLASPVIAAGGPDKPTSPNPYPMSSLTKRGLCIFGLCIGGSAPAPNYNLQSDPLNCGWVGNNCNNQFWLNMGGGGAKCSNGVCAPSTCNWLFDFNWLTGQCQNVAADTSNCGACNNKCNLPNANAQSCQQGTCVATSCAPNYSLAAGKCVFAPNTQTDPQNCGHAGNVCPSYNGAASVCVAGQCQAQCSNGMTWNAGSNQCVNTNTDNNNCGGIGRVCSIPRANAVCQNGQCIATSCIAGSYNISGVCTALDTTCDNNNCGGFNVKCSSQFPNAITKCVSSQCQVTDCLPGFAKVTTGAGLFSAGTTTCVSVNTQTDPKNCGNVGFVCPSYLNSAATTCVGGQCQAQCSTGFGWDTTFKYCRNVQTDTNNCGSCGKVCNVPNGSAQCVNGQCQVNNCNPGFYNIQGVCTQVNTGTDVNNCGSVGFKCPASYAQGSGVSCVNGNCRATTCLGMTDWDPISKTCKDVSRDMNNCGRCGSVCAPPNGQGQCSNGVCTIQSCNTGFQNVNGMCIAMDCQNDSNNCGAPGKVCSFPNGSGRCSSGQCVYTGCNPGWILSQGVCSLPDTKTDPNNCGVAGNVCKTFLNGGTSFCSNGVCQTKCNTGYDFDLAAGYCRDVTRDVNHCGSCGNTCLNQLTGASQASCVSGQCYASACKWGFKLSSGKCVPIDTTCDPNNCGSMGTPCVFPAGASGICQNGQCITKTCPAGYDLIGNNCIKCGPSQHARAKKSKIQAPKSLCPDHETACPIVGSASYAMAVGQHFSSFSDLSSGGIMGGSGGYECLDTKQALDSCGGCASTGEGQDCTKIRGAVGVGCDEGKCIVFSCQAGWKPNMAANKCVRAHGHLHNASTSSETTAENDKDSAAARHLAGRSHGHARHHGHS